MALSYSDLSNRLKIQTIDVWGVHAEAQKKLEQGEDIIMLSLGDPDFPTPREITDKLVQQVHLHRTHYSPAGGEPSFLQALADLETRVENKPFLPENFTIFPGGTAALTGVLNCILSPGDEIIVPEPMYIGYHSILQGIGAKLISVPLDVDNDFELDIELIKQAVTPATKAVMVNTPGNPAGNVMTRECLAELASVTRDLGLWLICDEVYSLFTYEEDHVSLLLAAENLDNVIVIDSLSKSHAMSGWRIGWAVASEEMTSALHAYCGATFFGCSQFIQDAAAFALSFNAPHILNMKKEYRARRDYVVDTVERLNGLSCYKPKAGMFVMVDTSQVASSGAEFAQKMLEKAGVSSIPGVGFGGNTKDYVRMSLTQPKRVLETAFGRIAKVI
jgi:arginine:pyruvate transaminase